MFRETIQIDESFGKARVPDAPARRLPGRAALVVGVAVCAGGLFGARLSELRCERYRCTTPTLAGVFCDVLRDDWTDLLPGLEGLKCLTR